MPNNNNYVSPPGQGGKPSANAQTVKMQSQASTLPGIAPVVGGGTGSGGGNSASKSWGLPRIGNPLAGVGRAFGNTFGGNTEKLSTHERAILGIIGTVGLSGSGYFIVAFVKHAFPIMDKPGQNFITVLIPYVFAALFTGIELLAVNTFMNVVAHTMPTFLMLIILPIGTDLVLTNAGGLVVLEVPKFAIDFDLAKPGATQTAIIMIMSFILVFIPFYCLAKAARGR